MKEIETKAEIKNIDDTKKKLTDMGCIFGDQLTQEDIVFLPEGIKFSEITKGTPVVRVRKSNEVVTLTLKKRLIAEHELIKLEKEIIVNDKEETTEIIKNMGFYEVARVNKKRIQCKHNGLTICVDDVEKLGYFIEVEKLTEDDDEIAVQESLFEFLKSLGIDKDNKITKGYDTLIINKEINIS